MKYLLPLVLSVFILVSCKNTGSRRAVPASGVNEVVVREVLQAGNYTYLHVNERGIEKWLAVPTMIASEGDVYYYRGGMLMENFESKDLERVFESVLFLEQVYTTPPGPEMESVTETPHSGTVEAVKMNFSVEPAEDGITIAELYSNKESYEGKTVKIRGAVTKFNPSIMDRNWIHLQDGSGYEGKFDLTVTSDQAVEPGNVIIVEGKISLDRDFGFGYYYEVLMENAQIRVD